jgi:ribosomal protein S18 acetylase RimI-like enzyme
MVHVRDAQPDDAVAVAELHIRAWQAGYRGLIADEQLAGLRVDEYVARYTFAAGDPAAVAATPTLLAVDGAVVRGFVAVGASPDDDTRDLGQVLALYVDPPSWRTGIGRVLLHRAHVRLRALGFDEAVLWVLVGNDRAPRFYEAGGWRADGARRHEEVRGVQLGELRYRRVLVDEA